MSKKLMNEHYYAVIMAGGGGSRLWPVSRKDTPKQMLRLSGDFSLFQITVKRLNGLFPPERIFVVTVRDQVSALQKETPQIPKGNYIIEPTPRGTASVVGLAAHYLFHKDKQAIMAVLTADHVIENVSEFKKVLQIGADIADLDYLVTLGIEPTYPSTGYGYIEQGEKMEQKWDKEIAHVKRFVEKPNEEKANLFLKKGGYFWNSGMFIWKAVRIIKEFQSQMPILAENLNVIRASIDTKQYQEVLEKTWAKITPQTVDYGIMEHALNVVVIPSHGLGWSDVGSWDSLTDFLKTDDDGNIVLGKEHILIDTHKTIINNEKSSRLLVTIGLEDIVIIDTTDALLVCKRGETQKVRQIVNILKQKKMEKYL